MTRPGEKLSVIIACHKEGALLRRAVASLREQTDPHFEIVIVNDASPDPITNQICRDLESHPDVRVVWHEINGGLSAARNSGYAAMTGEICVPLDADDTLPCTAIADIRKGFEQAPQAEFVFGDYRHIDLKARTEALIDCSLLCGSDGFLEPRKLCDNWRLLGTSPCRKSAWIRTGGYSQQFSYDAQDIDFFMRLHHRGGKGFYLARCIYNWHRSDEGMNSTRGVRASRRVVMANIDFFDAFGDGIGVRKAIMWKSLEDRDFVAARKLARELTKLTRVSLTTATLAVCAPGVSSILYSIKNDIFSRPSLRIGHR